MANYKYFQYFQPNPDPATNRGDCVIRAFCAACQEDWLAIFDELVILARKRYTILNDMDVVKEFLDNHGFTPCTISVRNGKKRPTMQTLIKQYPNHIIIGRCSKHIICARGGKVRDLWDSSQRPLYKYWIKQESN